MTIEPSHPVPVFLVDDHSMFRTGVRAELDAHPQVEVVGEAGSVAEAVSGIAGAAPAVGLRYCSRCSTLPPPASRRSSWASVCRTIRRT